MKTIKVEFYFSGRYINTDYTEVMEFEFPIDYTEEDMEKEITEELTGWLYKHSNATYNIIEG